jgi:hypothetical protein
MDDDPGKNRSQFKKALGLNRNCNGNGPAATPEGEPGNSLYAFFPPPGRTDSFNPATRSTTTNVDRRGLPVTESERYKLSRLSTAASATRDMHCV